MKKIILILFLVCLSSFVFAELKPAGVVIPKLTAEETKDGPELYGNSIFPGWGVQCTRFTYKVTYQDDKGRPPTYMRINLKGEWHDMTKKSGDYKTGALYIYEYVPTSTKPNFFYFEASNGAGKARAAIIDSPDQGPTVYSEKFDNNQVILLDKNGKEIWTYNTGKDMVEGVALSKDGNYVAAVTNFYIYLFSKESKEPLWSFCKICKVPEFVNPNFAGIAISADGKYVAADFQNMLYFFSRENNKPLWTEETESSALGVDMSDDGSLIALGIANMNGKGDKILLYNKEGDKLWEYRAQHADYTQTGNFYQPDITPDGNYIAVSTGCPDRRAYMFSKEGNVIFRSEQITYDSPVHKSEISDDGSLAAYAIEHMQGKDILELFSKEGKKLWGFSSTEDATSRAVSISADGNYIAAGTSAGRVYLFSKDSNKPLWKFSELNSQIGEVKLNADGSLLAAAGSSKKVYMFSRNNNKPLWEYQANTWVTKLDFNGEYVVGGTGLREYLGEGNREEKEFKCEKIIEPSEKMETGDGEQIENLPEGNIVCGDGMCIPSVENYENCPEDCCGEKCENEGMKEEKVVESEVLKEERKESLLQSIINFFRRLFK
ncbi:MAG: PQQ-binding-like beta-propeller repeat protein [Nanoarchaeota archaeon]|nr:PQQ-binding-like beta-propeller repeat protein [Nanoarchaeota archaeon]